MSDEISLGGDVETLTFIVRLDDGSDEDTMGLFGGGDGLAGVRPVSVEVLRQNLAKTAASLRKALADVGEQFGPLRLDEVQVGLEVSATGGVHLIGTAGVKAAITLVFRNPREDAK
jgi:hypothetical protein